MNSRMSRRNFGKKIAAMVSTAALAPQMVSCASAPGSLPTGQALLDELRGLDGALLIDEAARQSAASDFGGIIHRVPLAVLKPRSEQDIVKLIRLANRHSIKVAMRGQGHAMFGQCQVDAGIVIDSSTLDSIRMVTYDGLPAIEAGAGALWGRILDVAFAAQLTPPVNVDPGYLSVGGTLSTGGFGGRSWEEGFQTDHVLELQVVTGDGELITCSDKRNPDLFNSVLAGMGQTGLIVKATIPLVPAPTHVRFFVLSYTDLPTATGDMMLFASDRRFNHIDGRSAPRQGGGFTYNLEGGAFYSGLSGPSEVGLLSGLKFASRTARDLTYVEYYRRQGPLKPGSYPWLYLCLPASRFIEYATQVYAKPNEYAFSAPRFSVWNKRSIKRPLARMPNEELVVRFQMSRMLPAAYSEIDTLLRMNRLLYERARDVGGTRLTTSAIPMSRSDWAQYYGPVWQWFQGAKKRFDPANVLTPGPGIFSDVAG